MLPESTGRCEWKSSGWEYVAYGSENNPVVQWQLKIELVREAISIPMMVLKEDHRSKVSLIELEGSRFVIKEFILQKTWWWFKLTSVAFPTIGQIACANAIGLNEAGLLTPQPVLLMQRRRWGMAVESVLVYPYLEGKAATVSDANQIVNFVHKMHEADWVHRDPHPANFLKTTDGLATIDPVRAMKSKGNYLKAYDVMLMEHDMPEAPELYGREHLGILFTMAKWGHDFIRIYRMTKIGLRRCLGLGKSGSLMNSNNLED